MFNFAMRYYNLSSNPCRMVKTVGKVHKGLNFWTLDEFKAISPVFEEDVYEAISMKTCVEKRTTIGAPGQEAMKKVIAIYKEQLQ